MITISAIAFHFQTKGGDWKQERNRLETELERIGEDNQRLKVSLDELPIGTITCANGGAVVICGGFVGYGISDI